MRSRLGSSNFSRYGLGGQHEANVRFTPGTVRRSSTAPANWRRRLWDVGVSTTRQVLLELLRTLLQSVTWQEALARACAEVLEGSWASKYVGRLALTRRRSGHPSTGHRAGAMGPGERWQRAGGGRYGFREDADGAYLIAALMQRFLLGEGRARDRPAPLLICPRASSSDGSTTTTRQAFHCTSHRTEYSAVAAKRTSHGSSTRHGGRRCWPSMRHTGS